MMAASEHREARSLSDINYLAANPPQYPHHPGLRESLTLYISRVPGTQDIILSTFKPQKKNVTGEDIATSIYYVHLDSPEDELLAAGQQPKKPLSPRSSSESARSTIPRKPLPASAAIYRQEGSALGGGAQRSSLALHPPPANLLPPAPANPLSAATAEPRSAGNTVEGYRENPMFKKRPAAGPSGAPPATGFPTAPAVPPAYKGPGPSAPSVPPPGPDVAKQAPDRPQTPTRPGSPIAYHGPTSPMPVSNPNRASSPGKLGAGRPWSFSFSLTLIRRDPASGAQCNVGRITSFRTNVPTPEIADPSLDPENMGRLPAHTQVVDIRIETSGYAKYRDMPTKADVEAHRPSSAHSFAQQAMHGVAEMAAHRTAWRLVDDAFSRQVVMSYGPSWASNFKRAIQGKDRPASPVRPGSRSPDGLVAPRPFHARQGSTSTVGSVDSADGRRSPPVILHPGPGLKPKGYVFLSPWNGRCEFRTTSDGRGLKCRHVLDPGSGKIDPREVAQSIRDAQAMGRSRGDELSSALAGAKPVSELRFNLPNGAPRPAGEGSRLSAQFGKLLHRKSRSSDDESEDDEHGQGDDGDDVPLDLRLAKERAGGGHRGNRAKLGKLIIHDEGLKMLDLVVAANIGVWWASWGRMSG